MKRKSDDMIRHSEKARELFLSGYNCAQAVLCAYEDMTGLNRETAIRISSSFGGGVARMREVCGAVSGAAMVLGLLRGSGDPTDHAAKTAYYHLVQEFAARFSDANGSIICRELLDGSASPGSDPEKRDDSYYKKRPCPMLVEQAALILDELLNEGESDSPFVE